jgi:hypothetical protein
MGFIKREWVGAAFVPEQILASQERFIAVHEMKVSITFTISINVTLY